MGTPIKGDSGDGPYVQFEPCSHTDINCKYKDVGGKCIFEKCKLDQNPDSTLLWFYTCEFCKENDCAKPAELKLHICNNCLQRIQAKEALPTKCWICGATIETPPEMPFSGLCPKCTSSLKEMISWWNSGHRCKGGYSPT